ncbi:hypothetical protein AJ85_08380 [Alkalihalobacillus alcalophilus ATCC 27647 = CGMCC 1.3604]|uniref:Uncharacterized protein n=1 Tax=Alkalihalobacillus alcalophilus ATCC 27647 = CGMCC 1.3604 TaxID=1218173 RepID=A0A4S4K109_ALKAL|nr:hypothetical protein [Alkalihalobacillus alcalophilus]MED1560872.1 hypothetical protein [Alkalihalobacillus alcalophilus]THG90870.1 hypothetical protein AJ85_08380 [Alkalihalobacillus alcalophilus ATCC 27647 = CGMCC 1.3604]
MNVAFMKHELNLMLKSKKNLLFLLFLGIALLIYCFILLPNSQTDSHFDREQVEYTIGEKMAMQEDRERRGSTGYIRYTMAPVYAVDQFYIDIHTKMLTALEEGDYYRFLHLQTLYISTNQANFLLEDPRFFDSPFPIKDRKHAYYQTLLKHESLLASGKDVTPALIEEKTTFQALSNLLLGYLPFILLFTAIFFSSDVLIRDKHNKTIIQGVPIPWYRLLNLKSAIAFFYTLIVLSLLFLFGALFISIQYGWGSLTLELPIMPLQQTFTLQDYDTMTIGTFLLTTMSFIPICVFLLIRLNVCLNLLVKNQWVVLVISSLLLFSEHFYFNRTTRELFGYEVSFFPQTYFDFGKVITGEKSFLINLETITYTRGIMVLLITILIVEILLFFTAKYVNKRRFYK